MLAAEPPDLENPEFHFTDSYGSRIAQANIWFIEGMVTSQERRQVAVERAKQHWHWKVQATKDYNENCRLYVTSRIEWEWNLLNRVLRYPGLKWPSVASPERIMHLAHPSRIQLTHNYARMVEEEDDVE